VPAHVAGTVLIPPVTARSSLRFVPRRDVGSRPNIVVDGAPLASTVLTLSHWPVNATPDRFKRDTSTETALAYVEQNDPRSVADIVTNNHFDEDGLLSMFVVTQPRLALQHRELLADAARAGDFGVCRARAAARLCFVIEAYAEPKLSPLTPATFRGPPAGQVASLYRRLLPLMPRFLAGLDAYRRYWQAQDRHLDLSEALIASGRVPVEEEPELDLAIVRVPEQLPPRTVWRYLRREQAALHPFAIHNVTRCARLLRLQGRRIEFQYRYESWLQIQSRRPALRVDLTPMCRWLNRRERNGTWVWEDSLAITPRLRLTNASASSISPECFLRTLRHYLRELPPAWDPFDWVPGKTLP
jgi:hypothetical protein